MAHKENINIQESENENGSLESIEFEIIVDALKSKKKGDPLQHELILGRHGIGNSTLLRSIKLEIDGQAELSEKYVAINHLAEEQNTIYRLSDLWYEVLQELAIRFQKPLNLRNSDSFEDEQTFAKYLYTEIHRLLTAADRRAVLLLDNLDRILENLDHDAHLLRETLLNYNDLQIIGASTCMTEHFGSHSRPFYDFFRYHRLEERAFE